MAKKKLNIFSHRLSSYTHNICLPLEIVSQWCVTIFSEILFSPAFSTDREEARRYRWYFHRFAPYKCKAKL